MDQIAIKHNKCPNCKEEYQEQFCPVCGIPRNANSKLRPEYKNFEEFQLCTICYSRNPYGAKYCRNCGNNITSSAKDKNGHGWVDLGLSVLWSTETIEGLYLWNHSTLKLSTSSDMRNLYSIEIDNKDIATAKWGLKWRTPTKDEFEELIKKCKWEKIFLPAPEILALHVTGPNGNSINIHVTGHAGSSRPNNLVDYEPENTYSECCFWTSSESEQRKRAAYAFSFIGYHGFNGRKLTAKECKKLEFDLKKGFLSEFRNFYESTEQMMQRLEKERIQKRKEEQILSEMGDDTKERVKNEEEAHRRRIELWLQTPIEFNYDLADERKNTIKQMSKKRGCAIRPVADKKWQGKL